MNLFALVSAPGTAKVHVGKPRPDGWGIHAPEEPWGFNIDSPGHPLEYNRDRQNPLLFAVPENVARSGHPIPQIRLAPDSKYYAWRHFYCLFTEELAAPASPGPVTFRASFDVPDPDAGRTHTRRVQTTFTPALGEGWPTAIAAVIDTAMPQPIIEAILDRITRLQRWYRGEATNRDAGYRIVQAHERWCRAEHARHAAGASVDAWVAENGARIIQEYGAFVPPLPGR